MKSLEAFEENIKSTSLFTMRIHAMSSYLKSKELDRYPSSISPEMIKFVTFDESHFEKIFETGFIGLFANFEYFMYEFLKELYTRQPKAIPAEKTIKAEEILQFSSYTSVREFLIDGIAIENSYDIETWNNVVQKLFNIKPISEDTKIKIMIMNSMRNLFLHSGGHWNSKAYKDTRKIEKLFGTINSSEKIKSSGSKKRAFDTRKSALTPEIAYNVTIDCFQTIIRDIKSQNESKKKRSARKS